VLDDVIDPAFVLKSSGARLLDRLFEPIEHWLDGGAKPMPAMAADLMAVEAYSVSLEIESGLDLNWKRLGAEGFKPAYRRIGEAGVPDLRQSLSRSGRCPVGFVWSRWQSMSCASSARSNCFRLISRALGPVQFAAQRSCPDYCLQE